MRIFRGTGCGVEGGLLRHTATTGPGLDSCQPESVSACPGWHLIQEHLIGIDDADALSRHDGTEVL